MQSNWQNVLSFIIQGTHSSFGFCCWESPDPACQGREQDGPGLLSSGVTTDPSEISLGCMNLPCAMDLVGISTALWLAAEAGTHPTTMLETAGSISLSLRASRQLGALGGKGREL